VSLCVCSWSRWQAASGSLVLEGEGGAKKQVTDLPLGPACSAMAAEVGGSLRGPNRRTRMLVAKLC
jgi:hypothetical protein